MISKQLIVSQSGQIIELEIIQKHRKTLTNLLIDNMPDDKISLSRTARPRHQNRAKGIDDVNPALFESGFQLIPSRKVN